MARRRIIPEAEMQERRQVQRDAIRRNLARIQLYGIQTQDDAHFMYMIETGQLEYNTILAPVQIRFAEAA